MITVDEKIKKVPKLRFREFSDEWEEKKLGEIVKYTKGFAFKSDSYKQSGVRIVRASDLGPTFIKRDNKMIFMDQDKASGFKRYELKKGNIIITTVGSKPEMTESAVGRGIYVDEENGGLLNQNMLKIESEGINTRFIFTQINTTRYVEHIKSIKRGNANQANVTVKDLLDYKISYPSLKEQEKIAGLLTGVDEKIGILQKKVDLLQVYKKGIMQALFTQKLRFKSKSSNPYPDWQEKYLKNILTQGSKIPVSDTQQYKKITVKLRKLGIEFTDNSRKMADTRPFYTRSKGEIIIGKQNFFNGSIAIVEERFDGCICSNAIMSFKVNSGYDLNYIYEYISTPEYLKMRESLANGTGQKELSENNFLDFTIFVPIAEEQEKIANFLTASDGKINLIKKELDRAKIFKKALLQQMFV